MKILVLLSGGLDSAVVLASFIDRHDCAAIGFDYGQDHIIELEYAEKIAEHCKVPFRRFWITPEIPLVDNVVFAGRNLILAAHAVALAQAEKFDAIAVGCNSTDWDRFRDCRPMFWKAIENAAGTYGIEVLTPLLHATKSDIIRQARKLQLPPTWSCYAPTDDDQPCGQCLACIVRREAEEIAA